jgi:hypothetical protein
MKVQELMEARSTQELQSMAQRLAEFLKKNARPWLDVTGWGRLTFYRGISGQYQDPLVFVQRIRQDRRPLHTRQPNHEAFNALIAAAGGVANRSNAAFVTPEKELANIYGKVFVFMALGPIHTTFHKKWNDWTSVSMERLIDLLKDKDQLLDQIPVDSQSLSDGMNKSVPKLKQHLSNLTYYQNHEWAKSRMEEIQDILADKDKLQAHVTKEIQKEVLVSSDIFSDPNAYDKTLLQDLVVDRDLNFMATNRREVMVQAKSALLINPRFYENFVRSYLISSSNK